MRVIVIIQIRTWKKPINGAIFLKPLAIKIIRMVSMETSTILARKIRKGRIR
jgi:hypothetical protein